MVLCNTIEGASSMGTCCCWFCRPFCCVTAFLLVQGLPMLHCFIFCVGACSRSLLGELLLQAVFLIENNFQPIPNPFIGQ